MPAQPRTATKCVNADELSKEFMELTKDEKNKTEDPRLSCGMHFMVMM